MRRVLTILIACCVAGGCGSADEAPLRVVEPAAAPVAAPIDEQPLVPIEQLVGELIMTKLAGATATPEELAQIRALHVGNIILFGPNVVDAAQLRALVASLEKARAPAASVAGIEPGLLVSVDQEGGTIRNVPFAPPELTQPQLASGSIAAAEDSARRTAAALRAAGINMDLGPVADLADAPNRTMAGRAFGDSPQAVAPFVAATVRGLQRGGVAAAAKHFPGFGASTANSDEAIAYIDHDLARLREHDLPPFRAAIDAEVDAIMVSHGLLRALPGGGKLPATLDPYVVRDLLRDELGFDGVAMTDSMNARGFREAWGDTVPRACPVAVAAGIDLLLLTGTMETARLCRERILDAVSDGSLPEAVVRAAATRVAALKQRRAGSSPS